MKPLAKLLPSIDADHQYTHPQRGRLPGVTSILVQSGLSKLDFIPEDALTRGSEVHRILELIDKGGATWDDVPDIYVPFVVGWMKFVKEQEFSSIMVEVPVGHPVYGFAGTPDRVGRIGKKRRWAVVEIKTGSCPATTGLQLAAYALCLNKARFLRYAVVLPGDGSYKLECYRDPRDFQVYLAAATVADWQRRVAGMKEHVA